MSDTARRPGRPRKIVDTAVIGHEDFLHVRDEANIQVLDHVVIFDVDWGEDRAVTQEDIDRMQRTVSAFGELLKVIKTQSTAVALGGNPTMIMTTILEQAKASEAFAKGSGYGV